MSDGEKVPGAVIGRHTYYRYARCLGCGADLIPQREWNAADKDMRDHWREEGYRRQSVGSYCYRRACQKVRLEKEADDGSA